ncbi:hypothetical protein SCUP234_08825 [Seiridium cupressi]
MDPIESVARECDENLTLSKQLQQLQYTESAMDSAGEAANPNGRPAVFRSLAQEVLFVITTTFTIAMPSFLQGSILIVGPAIQRDLSMATAELTWMMASSSSGNHLGFVFSAIISGIVTEEFGWPAAFWLIAALYLVVAIIACFTVPSDDGEKLPLNMESLKQFDFVGAFLTITGIGLFTVGISCRVLVAVGSFWGDYKCKTTQFDLEDNANNRLKILAGRLLHKVSNKLLMAIGAAGFTSAFLLVALQRSGISYWALTFPALIFVVVGTDFEFNVVNMYVVSSLEKSQQSVASSIFQTAVKLATAIGLGICAALFTSVKANPASSGYYAHNPFEPYAALFLLATALSFTSLLIVPFLKIQTQGDDGGTAQFAASFHGRDAAAFGWTFGILSMAAELMQLQDRPPRISRRPTVGTLYRIMTEIRSHAPYQSEQPAKASSRSNLVYMPK